MRQVILIYLAPAQGKDVKLKPRAILQKADGRSLSPASGHAFHLPNLVETAVCKQHVSSLYNFQQRLGHPAVVEDLRPGEKQTFVWTFLNFPSQASQLQVSCRVICHALRSISSAFQNSKHANLHQHRPQTVFKHDIACAPALFIDKKADVMQNTKSACDMHHQRPRERLRLRRSPALHKDTAWPSSAQTQPKPRQTTQRQKIRTKGGNESQGANAQRSFKADKRTAG